MPGPTIFGQSGVGARVDLDKSNQTLYVDPAGDDDASGDISNPIQTIQEARTRSSEWLTGLNNVVQLNAGAFPLPDLSAVGDLLVFHSRTGGLRIKGTYSTIETFTAGSTVDNTITASPSPGWTVDEHVGRVILLTSGTEQLPASILSNTADTVVLGATPTSLGGQFTLPGSGSVDISAHASSITSAPVSSTRVAVAGEVTFQDIFFDGSGGGNIGVQFAGGTATADFQGCRFQDFGNAITLILDRVFCTMCHWEDCSIGIKCGGSGIVQIAGDNTFINCSSNAITVRGGGRFITPSFATLFVENTSTVFQMRNYGHLTDYLTYLWFDTNVGDYVNLGAHCDYERDLVPLKIFPGKNQPGRVINAIETQSRITIKDTASATMTGTTAFLRLSGTDVTYADFAANPSYCDANWNTAGDY
jgi:hypothetical protein